ncbi:hypothetical protein EW146_g3683 [Bondarzewia mesenterica]|uniref:very-long-chain enoyl-CoA reductase n=1 Tax=Bondarzewia mesenterica TaxID=1095465 RepID=A0A4S4LXE4_9AGAM|nr:hypothetical protein EW146_g3683 [Bondarzewia mesenterica]
MVQITVFAPRKTPLAPDLPLTLELPVNATIADLKAALASKYPKLYVSRQKITLKGEKQALDDEASLKDAGFVDGGEASVRDLGPQVSWKTVFIVEYAGPLVIHPLIYNLPNVFYGGYIQHSRLQQYIYGMVIAHFVKRELETLFSAYYHLLSGVALAYAIYSPTYSANSPYVRGTIRDDPRFLLGCSLFWLFAQLSNLKTHLTLRSLRPAGTRKLGIPRGYGFSLVSCPNYFFECLGWATIAIMSGSWVAWAFLAAGGWQMAVWAIKKHENYKKVFGKEYPKRKAMIPFIF